MKIILINGLLVFFLLFVSVIHAATPERMATQYYQHIDADQWNKIADMLHETALRGFRNLLFQAYEIVTQKKGKST